MYWKDEGFLLSKNNFDENSILIEVFTFYHGKYTGIVMEAHLENKKEIFKQVIKSY